MSDSHGLSELTNNDHTGDVPEPPDLERAQQGVQSQPDLMAAIDDVQIPPEPQGCKHSGTARPKSSYPAVRITQFATASFQ